VRSGRYVLLDSPSRLGKLRANATTRVGANSATTQVANQINEAADLWELERYLTQRRKEIDRKYDFRSSRLTRVLGRLLREHRVGEGELRGLGENKLKAIHSCAQFLGEDAA
jgi:hypothetical protein